MGQSSPPKFFPQPLPFGASPTNTVAPSQPVAQVAQPTQPFIPLNPQQQQQPTSNAMPAGNPKQQPPPNPFAGNPIFSKLVNQMGPWKNYPQSF